MVNNLFGRGSHLCMSCRVRGNNSNGSHVSLRGSTKRLCSRLVVLVLLMLVSLAPIQGRSDIVVIRFNRVTTGQPYSPDQNMTMPLAMVNISIAISGQWQYNISMRSRFQIVCGNCTTLTLAFVYPTEWTDHYGPQNVSLPDIQCFEIAVNGSEMEYDILSFDELSENYTLNTTGSSYLSDCSFVVFSTAAVTNASYWIDVNSDLTIDSSKDRFIFDYVVGTAKMWGSSTHEIVRMDI